MDKMKKEYTPIAMRCNQEQFDKIKPKLVESGYNISNISHFGKYPYLVSNYRCSNLVSNVCVNSYRDNGRVVHETWNEQIFLEACGIKTNNDMKYEISKEQILEVAEWGNSIDKLKIRGWFPDAFKTELIVGKWYKSKIECNKFKCVFNSLDSKGDQLFDGYGFDCFGNFFNDGQDIVSKEKSKKLVPMSESEVFEALKNEAVRRGYENGNYKCLSIPKKTHNVEDNFHFSIIENKLFHGASPTSANNVVFENGKWAEILNTMTVKQVEEKYNIKVIL